MCFGTQTILTGATQDSIGSSYVATAWSEDKDRACPSSRPLIEKSWKSHISAKLVRWCMMASARVPTRPHTQQVSLRPQSLVTGDPHD